MHDSVPRLAKKATRRVWLHCILVRLSQTLQIERLGRLLTSSENQKTRQSCLTRRLKRVNSFCDITRKASKDTKSKFRVDERRINVLTQSFARNLDSLILQIFHTNPNLTINQKRTKAQIIRNILVFRRWRRWIDDVVQTVNIKTRIEKRESSA